MQLVKGKPMFSDESKVHSLRYPLSRHQSVFSFMDGLMNLLMEEELKMHEVLLIYSCTPIMELEDFSCNASTWEWYKGLLFLTYRNNTQIVHRQKRQRFKELWKG